MSLHKALLVGINDYRDAPLRGCINDVMQMKEVLQRYYDFQDDSIRLLLDDDATCASIQTGLKWLAEDGVDADAVRVFHFSGHGSYVPDCSGDEPDGRDECLVPYDYKTSGMLTDDVLKTLYDTFPRRGNLTLVMDSCHSGSVQKDIEQDAICRFLPVSARDQEQIDAATVRFAQEQRDFVTTEILKLRRQDMSEEELTKKIRSLMDIFEKTRFGDIRVREANILLAGCRADQQSADARIAGDYHGAFTYYLAEAIRQTNGQITYRQLVGQTGNKLGTAHFAQLPQLEYRAGRDQRLAFQPFV